MNEDNHQPQQRSVILRIDAGSFSVTTIELAVQMAASVHSRLHAMFIEDEDLLHAAGLPCTREISFSTARERPTDVEQMQRSLRSMAEKIKKSLEQASERSQIAWSFDVIRGRMRDLELTPELDVVFTIFDQAISPKAPSKRYRRTRRILLVDNQSPHLTHALQVVLQNFARDLVEVLHINPGDQPGAGATDDLLRQIQQLGGWVSVIDLAHDQLAAVLAESDKTFDCAIISCHEDTDSLRNILKQLQCPVILVS
ncbi:MAG: hypothetical protein QNJ69_13455 [Gammaproteobacteria bacterium]|nr:hypothetical protein [Gammaproteobacteria bacterium]